MGAWLGAVDPRAADTVLRRVQAMVRNEATRVDRVELDWLDGLQGVALGDEPRVRRAQRELSADTSRDARYATRSLSGLWLDHMKSSGAADTLKAVADAAMHDGGFLLSVEAIDRLVVARALRQRGVLYGTRCVSSPCQCESPARLRLRLPCADGDDP